MCFGDSVSLFPGQGFTGPSCHFLSLDLDMLIVWILPQNLHLAFQFGTVGILINRKIGCQIPYFVCV